jgi:hypothetical protein
MTAEFMGFVVKEVSEPNPCDCFQLSAADATLYSILFCSLRMTEGSRVLHFCRNGENLRIVCVAIG